MTSSYVKDTSNSHATSRRKFRDMLGLPFDYKQRTIYRQIKKTTTITADENPPHPELDSQPATILEFLVLILFLKVYRNIYIRIALYKFS